MKNDATRPDDPSRDIFILSKGHASLGLYATMAAYDYFPIEEVYGFGA